MKEEGYLMHSIISVKEQCTGCGNCQLICNHKAVELKEDKYGFIRASINHEKCADCGVCLQVCPVVKPKYKANIISMMARSSDKSRKESASGGVFAGIALQMLQKKDMHVCGAAFYDGEIKHILLNSSNDLHKIQGSKYVQSNMNDVNERIYSILKNGGSVLFGGTPCQCEAVDKFLNFKRCSTDNLYLVDLICHGVPPFAFLKKELQGYSNINNIEDINFRWKKSLHKGKSSYALRIKHVSHNIFYKSSKELVVKIDRSPYYCAFMQGRILRDSCYECKFSKLSRVGDITIGDCGINDKYNFYPGESVSTILINSEKGKVLFDKYIKMFEVKSMDINDEIAVNPQLVRPFQKSDDWQQAREDFINDKMTLKELRQKYATPYKFTSHIRMILQKILPNNVFNVVDKIGRRWRQLWRM